MQKLSFFLISALIFSCSLAWGVDSVAQFIYNLERTVVHHSQCAETICQSSLDIWIGDEMANALFVPSYAKICEKYVISEYQNLPQSKVIEALQMQTPQLDSGLSSQVHTCQSEGKKKNFSTARFYYAMARLEGGLQQVTDQMAAVNFAPNSASIQAAL